MPQAARKRPRRIPNAEQRRLAILDAVIEVVAEGGIDAVTHRRVAQKAGVPLAATTYYFSSRDEMLLEAFRRYIALSIEDSAVLGDSATGDDVEAWIDVLVDYASGQLRHSRLLLAEYEMILFAARNKKFAAEYSAWQQLLGARLAEPLERLGVASPLETARAAVAAYRGLELDCLARSDRSRDTLRQRLGMLVRASLQAPAAARPETKTAGRSKVRRRTRSPRS